MKLGTRKQLPTKNTLAKFRSHPPTTTPSTRHMCGIQGRQAQNVNIDIYSYDHVRMELC